MRASTPLTLTKTWVASDVQCRIDVVLAKGLKLGNGPSGSGHAEVRE